MSKKTDSEHLADAQSGDAAQDAPPITDGDLHNVTDQAATPESIEAGDDAVTSADASADADPLAAIIAERDALKDQLLRCLLYTSPSPRDGLLSRMPSSA